MLQTIFQVRSLLDPLDAAPTECDGFMQLAVAVLTQHQIPHVCKQGVVRLDDRSIDLHCWLEDPDGLWMADYRARMWLTPQGAAVHRIPHGVFAPHDASPAVYQTQNTFKLKPLHPALLSALLLPMPTLEEAIALSDQRLVDKI